MKESTRREFLKKVATTSLAASTLIPLRLHGQNQGKSGLKLGMASYTFRNFDLNDTLSMTQRLAIKHIALKNFHLPLDSSVEKIRAVAAKVKDAGIDLYGCGVVYMKSEEEVKQAFDYASEAGMHVIIGVPEHHLLDLVNQKVQEYDLVLAIHNHGPGDERYPTPQSAYDKIEHLDKRIGLCLDIGHTVRIGLDPLQMARKYADRLYDIHIKDVTRSDADGNTIEMGRGIIDIPGFLKILLDINYQGIVAFEFEKDEQDPLPGLAESVGYVRGILDVL